MNSCTLILALLVLALIAQQVWLAIRIESHNNDWLDAMRAVSDELKRLRGLAGGSNGER